MRKKGKIWRGEYQELIVDSYTGGMYISDVLELPGIARLSPSEYTIRNILRANGVKANWRKKKRKPALWSPEVVDRVVAMRNEGKSIRAIRDAVNAELEGASASKSTIVRILEENADGVHYRPWRRHDIWKPSVTRQVVKMYRNGMLINEIRRSEPLREFRPSGYVIRDILKSHGVKLTWKKGELRRWPPEVQRRILELYRSGMRFADILAHPELKEYRPTNYAIRKILRKFGVRTKGETRYKQPISEERFRAYRDGKLGPAEEAIVHKHLAVDEAGREEMLRRMRLSAAERLPDSGTSNRRIRTLRRNAKRWAGFFSWAIRSLSDEGSKREIILLGLEYGMALRYLDGTLRRGDDEKEERAWSRLAKVAGAMAALYSSVLEKPARSFRIQVLS